MTGSIKVTILIEGAIQDVAELLLFLNERGVQLSMTPEASLEVDWNTDPALERLTKVERRIMQLDLEYLPRRRIAQELELTVNTVTVYRRSIRAKLRRFPAEQHPLFVRKWLQRFPGQPGAGFRPVPSATPEPSAAPESETRPEPNDPTL